MLDTQTPFAGREGYFVIITKLFHIKRGNTSQVFHSSAANAAVESSVPALLATEI